MEKEKNSQLSLKRLTRFAICIDRVEPRMLKHIFIRINITYNKGFMAGKGTVIKHGYNNGHPLNSIASPWSTPASAIMSTFLPALDGKKIKH